MDKVIWQLGFRLSREWRCEEGGFMQIQVYTDNTDETVKVCAYNFPESAFPEEKQAIIELTLRTI